MNETQQNADANLKAVFQSALNRHGHPFQYAVIRRAHELWDQKLSHWQFVVSEFPVEVQGHHTRIDFVLCEWNRFRTVPLRFLIAECKRANPALINGIYPCR